MVSGGGEVGKPGIGNPEWAVCVTADFALPSPLLSPLAAGKLQPDTRSTAPMYIVNRNPCRHILFMYIGGSILL
jgi:hypothetical protein